MAGRQQAVAEVVLKDPAVAGLSSFIGVDGTNATLNSGRLLISLKPRAERDASATEVIRRLGPELHRLAGITLYMQPVQDLSIEDRVSRTQYQFSLTAPDAALLTEWVPRLLERLRELPQLADVASDLQDRGLQAWIEIDRAAAARLGVSTAAIDNALYNAYGQRLVSTIFTQATQYRVVLEVQPEFRSGPDAIAKLYVAGSGGVQVPLSALVKVTERPATLAVNHVGQFPSATLSFNLAPGAALGDAVEAIREVEAGLGLPLSVETQFQGAALAFQASLTSTLLLILAAVPAV